MRIVALLSFYDESPTWLATCVAGIGRWCDALVAVDGAYALFPGGRPRSHPQQTEAIHQTAEAMNLELVLHQPAKVWEGNEVGKRAHCLTLAGTICQDGDWVAVVDADYHVLRCEPDIIRGDLAQTEHRVATYTLLDGKDFLSDPKLAEYVNGRDCDTDWTVRTRDLHRWDPTLRVGPAHWTYSVIVDGKREWARGPWEKQIDCLELNANLVMYHRTQDRAKVRRDAAKGYYDLRNEHRTEWMESYDPPLDEAVPDGLVALG